MLAKDKPGGDGRTCAGSLLNCNDFFLAMMDSVFYKQIVSFNFAFS